MSEARAGKSFWKAFGPGLLWAGAAIGVSHLVQSTRAGASYGFALLGLVVIANVFKYPAFSFGPRYAAATGTSLLEGYRRRGRWALVLYALLTLGTMFTVQAAVTVVTAGLAASLLGLPNDWVVPLAAALTAACAALLFVGHYRWLDRIIKVVVAVLTISTFTATIALLLRKDWSTAWETARFLPDATLLADATAIGFIVGLVGWMPSAFDISIWSSLWTLAKRRESKYVPSVKESLLDFKIGYLGTAILALCFVTLGAGVMFGATDPATGEALKFAQPPVQFAGQVIRLYTESLGAGWAGTLIAVAAFTVMFSTTLTVVDGFPRAIGTLVARFQEPEVPDRPSAMSRRVYWTALVVLGLGAVLIIAKFATSLKALVDLATMLSFLTAPALAWLNQCAILGDEVAPEHRPGRGMILYSWLGILFSLAFALWFAYVKLS